MQIIGHNSDLRLIILTGGAACHVSAVSQDMITVFAMKNCERVGTSNLRKHQIFA
jgi:hypothetical protein